MINVLILRDKLHLIKISPFNRHFFAQEEKNKTYINDKQMELSFTHARTST
jgi:hypothetical protein